MSDEYTYNVGDLVFVDSWIVKYITKSESHLNKLTAGLVVETNDTMKVSKVLLLGGDVERILHSNMKIVSKCK